MAALTRAQDEGKRVAKVVTIPEESLKPMGPPNATVARRAQSYSDFHYAVTAVLSADEREKAKRRAEREGSFVHMNPGGRSRSMKGTERVEHIREERSPLRTRNDEIADDLEFAEWYGELEGDLVEASHDEYK